MTKEEEDYDGEVEDSTNLANLVRPNGGKDELDLAESRQLAALLGPGHEVVSVEKEQTVKSEEVVMVNGTPIALEGREGELIKASLLSGTIPNQDLINHLLMKAGLVLKPVKQVVQAEVTVSSTIRTCEASVVKSMETGSTVAKGVTVSQESSCLKNCQSYEIDPGEKSDKELLPNNVQKSSSSISPKANAKDFSRHLDEALSGSKTSDELFTLFLWSRFYATPSTILTRFATKIDQLNVNADKKQLETVYSILSDYLTWFPEDFGDEAAMQKLRKIFTSHNSSKTSNHLIPTLSSHLNAIKRHNSFLDAELPLDLPNDISLHSTNPSVSAQELTRLEMEYLSFLGPAEFVNHFARENSKSNNNKIKKNSVSQQNEKDKNNEENYDEIDFRKTEERISDVRFRSGMKTKNFDAYVEWFNHLSFSVAASVCLSKKKKERMKVIEYWIEVARVCVNIGNFNSLMGIITGLNMFPVSRLKKTWSHVRSGKFSVLEHQMDPTSNFLSYRSTLDAAVIRSESATDAKQKIIIPFFSLFVKDLYTAKEEVCLEEKFDLKSLMQISMTIREFSKLKNVNCPFEKLDSTSSASASDKNPSINTDFSQFLRIKVPCSERLDYESFLCEGPKNQMERDQFKTLKTKFKQEDSHKK